MEKDILNRPENDNLYDDAVEETEDNVLKMPGEFDLEPFEEVVETEAIAEYAEDAPSPLKLSVLKLNVNDNTAENDEFETLWHELVSVYKAKKSIPVTIVGIEKTQLQGYVVVAYYKNQRILVPMTEMLINLDTERG